MTPQSYDPTQPSTITLGVRVTPHALDPTRTDLQVVQLSMQNLPGGWDACHGLLLEAAKVAHTQGLKAQPPPLVQVAQTLPTNGGT